MNSLDDPKGIAKINQITDLFISVKNNEKLLQLLTVAVNGNNWIDIDGEEEGLLLDTLIDNPQYYRIKPEVKYRPFKNLKECLEEMQCHIPYGWIKTDNNVHRLITLLDEDRILIGHREKIWTYEKIFESFNFMDGTPFGVKE